MNLHSFEKAVAIREQIVNIDVQLSLLSNNNSDNYITSYYDVSTINENDNNEIDTNTGKKVNKYKISDDLISVIKEELFRQKSLLEEEFNLL